MSLKNRIIGLAAVGAAALVLVPSAVAKPRAATSTTSATSQTSLTTSLAKVSVGEGCDAPSSQVFAPWGDNAFYSLVADGGFESGAGDWSLEGGARVVKDGDDGVASDGVADAYALELGSGASATSPDICVGTDSAYYRLFANAVSAKKNSANLRVEVLFSGRVVKSDDLTSATGLSAPTAKLAFVPTALDSLLGSLNLTSAVQIRVSSLNGATVRVDDVHMDPRMH